jgi:putative transposase
VWLYHVVSVSLKDVEVVLAERDITVTRELLPEMRHRSSRHLNNRATNSHRPTRRRERQMQRFRSAGQAHRFLSAHSMTHGHFGPRWHLMTAGDDRRARIKAFRTWHQETCAQAAI